MRVEELIVILQRCPIDAMVLVDIDSGDIRNEVVYVSVDTSYGSKKVTIHTSNNTMEE